MDYHVRISNANMVMGNIREINPIDTQRDCEDRDALIDFLFESKDDSGGFDIFKKM